MSASWLDWLIVQKKEFATQALIKWWRKEGFGQNDCLFRRKQTIRAQVDWTAEKWLRDSICTAGCKQSSSSTSQHSVVLYTVCSVSVCRWLKFWLSIVGQGAFNNKTSRYVVAADSMELTREDTWARMRVRWPRAGFALKTIMVCARSVNWIDGSKCTCWPRSTRVYDRTDVLAGVVIVCFCWLLLLYSINVAYGLWFGLAYLKWTEKYIRMTKLCVAMNLDIRKHNHKFLMKCNI